MSDNRFDYCIVGGGVSGLVLAYTLSQSQLAGKKVALIDPDWQAIQHRTLAYWTDISTPFDALAQAQWSRVQVAFDKGSIINNLEHYTYRVISGNDLYQFITKELQAHPTIKFITDTVQVIDNDSDNATVKGEQGTYKAQWVFDSRFKPPSEVVSSGIKQHFKGWFIKTKRPVFDPSLPTLMDFRVPQDAPWTFCYVLPFSAWEALIELVSTIELDDELVIPPYLQQHWKLTQYKVASKEHGVNLLADYHFPRKIGERTMAIGRQGGLLKPSTGYAFTRIMKDSEAIVRSLQSEGAPWHVSTSPLLSRWADSVLLKLVRRHPHYIPRIFNHMFQKNFADAICAFLDESMSFPAFIKYIASLPKGIFIKTAIGL